jgi:hypothetical protein
MSTCSGIRADGGRCQAQAMRNSEWCVNHHPDQVEVRRRRASKGGRVGGRGRPAKLPGAGELAVIRGELATLYGDVLSKKVDTGVASVAVQVQNARLRAVEIARRVEDQDELEERLAHLEARIRGRGVG